MNFDGLTLDPNIDSCQYLGDTRAMTPNSARLLDMEPVGPIPAVACCAPIVREPLGAEEAVGLAAVLKALADPARIRLLSLLSANEGGEACVCDLTEPLDLSQPTVSHHLKTLVDAGLVQREKRGVWAYFSLVPGALDDVARVLSTTGIRS